MYGVQQAAWLIAAPPGGQDLTVGHGGSIYQTARRSVYLRLSKCTDQNSLLQNTIVCTSRSGIVFLYFIMPDGPCGKIHPTRIDRRCTRKAPPCTHRNTYSVAAMSGQEKLVETQWVTPEVAATVRPSIALWVMMSAHWSCGCTHWKHAKGWRLWRPSRWAIRSCH